MREVVVAAPTDSVRDVAALMAEREVGTVVVVDAERRPLGVLTDRDVTVRCVARERDPDATPVSALMTAPMISVRESTPIETALERMEGIYARRLAVVDGDGRLAGILTLDDVLELLVEEAGSIGRLLAQRSPAERTAAPGR